MAAPPAPRYTYDDLERFPDDNLRRELIGGELIVTPAPRPSHQEIADELTYRLRAYTKTHGGRANSAPLDVVFAPADVVEPDVVFLTAQRLHLVGERYIEGPPDVVVEVSSPSTRHLELVRKRDLYERYGVAEYWYVDLDAERIAVHRLTGDRYADPTFVPRGDVLESPLLPGFSLPVAELFDLA
ncbi:MAG: Uma2 family endonuclease [Actinomycetota bacterium]|nr:Uma2 family endonuclease [Actinomycetota bacterium]